MPTIKLLKNKRDPIKTNQVKEYSVFYQNKSWRRLRAAKFKANPVCEICETKGIVRLTDEIHHKKPWNTGKTIEDKWNLFLDWKNLQSLCTPCHHIEDQKMRYC